MERNGNLVRIAIRRLIHGVIYDFPKHMVQAAYARAPDIHAGPHADCFEALHDLNIAYAVIFCHLLPPFATPNLVFDAT